MEIKDFFKNVSSQQLNESLGKKFGVTLKLRDFSDVQLEDARNKLRTRISQFEVTEGFNSILQNSDYQKTKLFLDVVNKEIYERTMTPAEKKKEKTIKKKTDKSDMKKSMQKQYGNGKGKSVYFATVRKRAMDHSVPEGWIDSALSRIQLGEADRAELKSELSVRYDLNESQASWILMEGEEEKAEIILATKDVIDRITSWIDDIANIRGEQILELMDAIKSNMGADTATKYSEQVRPALDAIYSALETARQGISSGLSIVAGEEVETMGGSMTTSEPPVDDVGMGDMPPAPDSMPSELGVGSTPSREKRESVDYSRKLSLMLNSKKKV